MQRFCPKDNYTKRHFMSWCYIHSFIQVCTSVVGVKPMKLILSNEWSFRLGVINTWPVDSHCYITFNSVTVCTYRVHVHVNVNADREYTANARMMTSITSRRSAHRPWALAHVAGISPARALTGSRSRHARSQDASATSSASPVTSQRNIQTNVTQLVLHLWLMYMY